MGLCDTAKGRTSEKLGNTGLTSVVVASGWTASGRSKGILDAVHVTKRMLLSLPDRLTLSAEALVRMAAVP
jgi:hypothetical protein